MKNKISDLRNHLFAQLERLNNEELSAEELAKEIQRANAMEGLGKVIVDSAKTQVIAMKIMGNKSYVSEVITDDAAGFIEEKPKAEYSNNGHLSALKKYGN